MELLNAENLTFKTETATSVADVAALLHARLNGNGHVHVARNGGNDHRRRPRPQIRHGYRRAALKADTALMLVELTGMTVAEAVERCSTNANYYAAMKALKESGNTALRAAVLKTKEPVHASAARVKNAAAAITAVQKCSVLERELVRLATGMTSDPVTMLLNLGADELVAVTNALGTDWIWDRLISPVLSKPSTESMKSESNQNVSVA